MEVISQNERLDIKNIDCLTPDIFDNEVSKHGRLLPNTMRCIISGPSNCGKTNVVFNLITKPNGLSFNNVYIFSKSLNQPKYLLLEKILNDVPDVSLHKFDASSEIIEPNNAKPYSVFIFDDVSSENHDMIRTYFSMGRHNHIDSIYIGQTYSKIPKQLIRDNVNVLIVFKQDEKNLKHIYNDHVGADMTFEKFRDVCGKAWKEKYGFLVIDKERSMTNGRYRIGFDKFVLLH
jgi:hypothetical protein